MPRPAAARRAGAGRSFAGETWLFAPGSAARCARAAKALGWREGAARRPSLDRILGQDLPALAARAQLALRSGAALLLQPWTLRQLVLIAAVAGAVERRVAGRADRDEPVGLLTHHLVHDEATWGFCEALLELVAGEGLSLASAENVFSGDNRIVVGL